MKRIYVLAACALLIGSLGALSQSYDLLDTPIMQSKQFSVTGCLVDNQCAVAHKLDLDSYIKNHPKDCALMPACRASGYSIYLPNGQLYHFTPASDAKIIAYLKNPKNGLQVEVKAAKNNLQLDLISIRNKE